MFSKENLQTFEHRTKNGMKCTWQPQDRDNLKENGKHMCSAGRHLPQLCSYVYLEDCIEYHIIDHSSIVRYILCMYIHAVNFCSLYFCYYVWPSKRKQRQEIIIPLLPKRRGRIKQQKYFN